MSKWKKYIENCDKTVIEIQHKSTKEQLRDEIISELNEFTDDKWFYKDNMFQRGFITELVTNHMQRIVGYDIKDKHFWTSNGLNLPLSLASKIIKFFELEESE